MKRVGNRLLFVTLIASQFLFLLGTSFLDIKIGIWRDVEPIQIGLHLSAACAALGILLLLAESKPDLKKAARKYLPVSVLFFLFFWTLVGTPFVTAPALSILGDPRLGAGALSYLALALLFLASILIWNLSSIHRKWMAGSAIFSFALLLLMQLLGTSVEPRYKLHGYNDFFIFHSILVFMLIFSFFHVRRSVVFAVYMVLVPTLSLIMTNRSGVLVGLTTPVYILFISRYNFELRRKILMASVAVLPILVAMLISIYGIYRQSASDVMQVDSISSRYLMYEVILRAFWHQPSALLTGFGWGHFADLVGTLGTVKEVSMAEGLWSGFSRVNLHSHHQAMEAFMATGLIGFILWLSFPAMILMRIREQAMLVVGGLSLLSLTALSSLWFHTIESIPLMALSFAAIMGDGNSSHSPSKKTIHEDLFWWKAARTALFVIMCFVAANVWYQLTHGFRCHSIMTRMQLWQRLHENISLDPKELTKVAGPGGVHFIQLFKIASDMEKQYVESNKKEEKRLLMDDFIQAQQYLENYDDRLSKRFPISAFRYYTWLSTQSDALRSSVPWPDYERHWYRSMQDFVITAPQRSDLAATLFMWLLRNNKSNKILNLGERMLQMNPHDPVALWFTGMVLLDKEGLEQQGTNRIRRGISTGIEKILPDIKALNRMILSNHNL